MSEHITEDQLTEMVIEGQMPAACRAHLQECVACSERLSGELELFGSSMDAFNASTMAWSRSRPAPVQHVRRASASARLWFAPAALTFAAAAVALITVPVWHTHTPDAAPIAAVASGDNAAQIAQDNALMQSVNVALNANESFAAGGVQPCSHFGPPCYSALYLIRSILRGADEILRSLCRPAGRWSLLRCTPRLRTRRAAVRADLLRRASAVRRVLPVRLVLQGPPPAGQ